MNVHGYYGRPRQKAPAGELSFDGNGKKTAGGEGGREKTPGRLRKSAFREAGSFA
mgnify:CR=1 FL=1